MLDQPLNWTTSELHWKGFCKCLQLVQTDGIARGNVDQIWEKLPILCFAVSGTTVKVKRQRKSHFQAVILADEGWWAWQPEMMKK